MAKRRQNGGTTESGHAVHETETHDSPESHEAPVIKKRVRKVEEYDMFEPVEPVQPVRPPNVTDDVVLELDDEDLPVNPLEALLSEIQDSTDAKVRVVRLPDPPNYRGKFRQPCAEEVYVGYLSLHGHTLETLYDEIQHSFGGGRYRLQIRIAGQVKKTWTATIADPPTPPAPPTPAPIIVQQPTVDPLDALVEQAERLKRLKRALSDETPQADKDPKTVIAELLLEDDDVKRQAIRGLLGVAIETAKEEPLPWYARLLIKLAENPALAPLIANAVARYQQLVQSGSASGSAPQLNSDTTNNDAMTEEIIELARRGQATMGELIDEILDLIAADDADRGTALLRAVHEGYPTLRPIIDGMVERSPAEAVQMLSMLSPLIAQQPNAERVIANVQTQLRRR